MSFSGATYVFLISLLAIPATYTANLAVTTNGSPFVIFCFGVGWLSVVLGLSYFFTRDKTGKATDPLYYLLGIFTFASVVDLIIGLENDGFIEGFMEFYLRNGEPYLKTAHGTMICYWDGIGHYAMYLMILSAISWSQSYREVALYWVGSVGNSMLVLLLGSLLGNIGVKWSFLLNSPYLVIPFVWGVRLLNQPSDIEDTMDIKRQAKVQSRSIWRRPVDILFICYFIGATGVALLRGLAVLGCKTHFVVTYMENYEPYLKDPTAYPKVQVLVYLFYFIPFYLMSIYGLLCPGNRWMIDWSLLQGGAAAQAQISHIGSALHYRTPFVLRVSSDPSVALYFWIINIALLVVPQIMVYRFVGFPEFFIKTQPKPRKKTIATKFE